MKASFAPVVKEKKNLKRKWNEGKGLHYTGFFCVCVPGNSLCSSPPVVIRRDEKKRSLISFENSSDAV